MTTQTQDPPATKPYVCGTMDGDELHEAAVSWLYSALTGYWTDAGPVMEWHIGEVAEGAQDAIGPMLHVLMIGTLGHAQLDFLVPLVKKYVIPHVDWAQASKDACKRHTEYEASFNQPVPAVKDGG